MIKTIVELSTFRIMNVFDVPFPMYVMFAFAILGIILIASYIPKPTSIILIFVSLVLLAFVAFKLSLGYRSYQYKRFRRATRIEAEGGDFNPGDFENYAHER